MKIVYTTGVFDIIHNGHISTLKRAKEHGDRLIVGVQDDDSVFNQKGKRPVMSCAERIAFLESLDFIDSCVSYSDPDQRNMLEKIMPDVVVQTEEWVVQIDRSNILDYLNKNGIKLVLLPIRKEISSSEIKRRIVENAEVLRNDIGLLYKILDLVPIGSLAVYENFDPIRVNKLCEKIYHDQVFFNPITVAKYKNTKIVIDGANRLEALKRMGCRYAFVCYVDYLDDNKIMLTNNAHFVDVESKIFMGLLVEAGLSFELLSESEVSVGDVMGRLGLNATFIINGVDHYAFCDKSVGIDSVFFLNKLVDVYLGKYEIRRISELSQDQRWSLVKIVFRKFTIEELFNLSTNGILLNSGITWHKLKNSIIRFRLPLSLLRADESEENLKNCLLKEIEKKMSCGDIRYYPSNVYVCDEWH